MVGVHMNGVEQKIACGYWKSKKKCAFFQFPRKNRKILQEKFGS